MKDKQMLENKLIEIFKIVFEFDDDCDFKSLRQLNERSWDSLGHTSLIVAIESEFGIRLEISDMERMTSFASTYLLLEEKHL